MKLVDLYAFLCSVAAIYAVMVVGREHVAYYGWQLAHLVLVYLVLCMFIGLAWNVAF